MTPIALAMLALVAGADARSATTTAPAADATLEYRDCARLGDERITGLSGITYSGDDTYWGVLERQSKLVRFKIRIDDDGSIAAVTAEKFVTLAQRRRDIEAIAFAGDDRAFVSSEAPAVFEVRLSDGRIVGELAVPPIMRGIVPNYGLESLALSADGKTLWTANERALKVDGNPQTPATPISAVTRVRLLRYDRRGDGFVAGPQFEYETSGVHDWGGTIGLCDLASLPDGRLLALERSAAQNLASVATIRTRIFVIDATGATDISKPPFDKGLVERRPEKVTKAMLYDAFVCDDDGENLEGICLGPQLSRDRFAVIGVVDNTDGGLGLSETSVVTFVLSLRSGGVK